MKNHESESVNELILKIINLRKEYNVKDETTGTEIYHKLKKGSVDFCGQRFTWIRPEFINIQARAEEIEEILYSAMMCIYGLQNTIELNCLDKKNDMQQFNGNQLIGFLKGIHRNIEGQLDNVKQLKNPLIKIKREI